MAVRASPTVNRALRKISVPKRRSKKGVVGQTAYRARSWLAQLTKLNMGDQTEERWAGDVARSGFWLRKINYRPNRRRRLERHLKRLDEAETCLSRPDWWGKMMMMMMISESNIKMDLKERMWTGFIWLRIGTSGMLLWICYRTFHAIKCGECD